MKSFKKKIALFMCLILAIPTMLAMDPTDAKAASYKAYSNVGSDYGNIAVSVGEESLYAGDFAIYNYYKYNGKSYKDYTSSYLSFLSGVSYTSDNSDVVSVDSTGKMTAKKAGTATITETYKKKSTEIVVTVKSSLSKKVSSEPFKSLEAAGKTLIKAFDGSTEVTSSNSYKIIKSMKSFQKVRTSAYKKYGSKTDYGYPAVYYGLYYNSTGYDVIAPNYLHASLLYSKAYSYYDEVNPLGTSANLFSCKTIKGQSATKGSLKASSSTGKKKAATITLNKKVTADMMRGLHFSVYSSSKSDSVSIPVWIVAKGSSKKYKASATFKKGSKKVAVAVKAKNFTMKKGTTYQIVGNFKSYYKSGYEICDQDFIGFFTNNAKKLTFKAK